MKPRKKKAKPAAQAPRARNAHGRQRQRLIDACISALHLYGPSRTTVEKVVAIAKMSPGIVRFYFDSKASMLVASLQFLAAEFEEQVLVPVSKLKSRPVAALELLVDLYLDPEIASPRKVSVWYAFWGEASSRQEYYDICGQKDESFAVMVRELIGGLIDATSQPQLDRDGIALGLIGALEILWQVFAFQNEGDIDRREAKRRCMAYLRSIFPGKFVAESAGAQVQAGNGAGRRFAGWTYANTRIFALERARLFRDAAQTAGHAAQIPHAGDFLTADTGLDRALLVRGAAGAVHALRNSCPVQPHALVEERHGHFVGGIECKLHGLEFGLDGRHRGTRNAADLDTLDLQTIGGVLALRSSAGGPVRAQAASSWLDAEALRKLEPLGAPQQRAVGADWKILVEQWLESVPDDCLIDNAAGTIDFASQRSVGATGWSADRYRTLAGVALRGGWRSRFVAPNQLLEWRPDGLSIFQVLPVAPGRCRLLRFDFTACSDARTGRALRYLAGRMNFHARPAAAALAESLQSGLIEFGYHAASNGTVPPALAWFRNRLIERIPALALDSAPAEL